MTEEDNSNWEQHGGLRTIVSYKDKTQADKDIHFIFFQKMGYYHIDYKERLFVLVGFTFQLGPVGENFISILIWDRPLLETDIAMDKSLRPTSIRYLRWLRLHEEIYIGHSPTQR
ncbi:MAG TPA: hypothetical protein DCW83_01720 [Saprospirales bacterium]|jgi:serine/threonine protein phosphatase 1|nr:hypothetical protein [Saprospirales bacterium]